MTSAQLGGEKPLHVRVAEALGYEVRDDRRVCHGRCVVSPPEDGNFPTFKASGTGHIHGDWSYLVPAPYEEYEDEWEPVLNYDTDWNATGPLIERLGLSIGKWDDESWASMLGFSNMTGPTALIAVCNLILALYAAGKLPKVTE